METNEKANILEPCLWYKLYHNENSTTGEAMRKSVELGRNHYQCNLCDGYSRRCYVSISILNSLNINTKRN